MNVDISADGKTLITFTPRDVVDARSRRRINAAGGDDFNHVKPARPSVLGSALTRAGG